MFALFTGSQKHTDGTLALVNTQIPPGCKNKETTSECAQGKLRCDLLGSWRPRATMQSNPGGRLLQARVAHSDGFLFAQNYLVQEHDARVACTANYKN